MKSTALWDNEQINSHKEEEEKKGKSVWGVWLDDSEVQTPQCRKGEIDPNTLGRPLFLRAYPEFATGNSFSLIHKQPKLSASIIVTSNQISSEFQTFKIKWTEDKVNEIFSFLESDATLT